MDFELSDRCQDFRERLLAFMDERVYPAEHVYEEQLRQTPATRTRSCSSYTCSAG